MAPDNMYSEPEKVSIFSKYILLEGDPSLPVTPGTYIGKALRMSNFHQIPSMDSVAETQDSPQTYTVDTATCKIYATSLGLLHVDNDKIVIRPILYPADDNMTVYGDIYHKDYSGSPLQLSHYASALWQLDVTAPINAEKFHSALEKAKEEDKSVTMVPLCKGKNPVHETPPIILPLLPERTLKPLQDPQGSVDYKNQGIFAEVPAHTPVAVRVPTPEPSNGFDIYGNALPIIAASSLPTNKIPSPPSHPPLRIGTNVYGILQRAGHTVYYSACPGLLSVRDDILSITDVLRIEGDINMKTGNIIARKGSVHITGTVTSGFSVEAEHHVIVDGDVEQAEITCGGDVFVGGAISMGGRNKITCNGSVYSSHMHNAHIVARHRIVTSGCIVNSDLTAGKAIHTCTSEGTVLGSTLTAGTEINIAGAGGEHGSPPILIITENAKAKKALQREPSEAENILSQSISKLDTWIKKHQESELTGKMRQHADKLLQRAKSARRSLVHKLAPHIAHSIQKVTIRGTVASGTLITMDGQTLTIEESLSELSLNPQQHFEAVLEQQQASV